MNNEMTELEKKCVLICAYNEEKKIADVVKESLKYIPNILVVNDGSKDKTAILAKEAGATVLSHETNKGKGTAFKTGFRYILENGFNAAITLDGDGQHDPADIPGLLNKLYKDNYSMVVGARNFDSKEVPRKRRIGNKTDSWVHSVGLGQRIEDPQCGYRIFTKQVIEKYHDKIDEKGYFYELVFLAMAASNGEKIGWQTVKTIYPEDGTSNIRNWPHIGKSIIHYFNMAKGKYKLNL